MPETGLYDMRNRFYSPALNRFLQTDPIGFAGDALNLYRYCGDDPVDRSDPMGLQDHPIADIVWQMACHMDSGNMLQGTFQDLLKRLQPAGMDGGNVNGGGENGGGGGGKQVAPEHEGLKVQWSDEGNRNMHEPIVHDKTGQSYNALTEDAVTVTAENNTLTAHYTVNVRYSDKVGPHNKETQKLEPDHGNEIDRDFRYKSGPKIIESFTRRGGPLEGQSLETARSMLEHRLDVARQGAHDASHERHDYWNPLTGRHGDHIIVHPDGLNY